MYARGAPFQASSPFGVDKQAISFTVIFIFVALASTYGPSCA